MPNPSSRTKSADEEAETAASAFVNLLTSLATGALVFSIGLVSNAKEYDQTARVLLIIAWVLFSFSVIAGLLAQATIPMHKHNKKAICDSAIFNTPVKIQQISFGLAAVCLALVLVRQLNARAGLSDESVPSAGAALKIAWRCVDTSKYNSMLKIELIKGDDPEDPADSYWHLELGSRSGSPTVDVLVSVLNGTAAALQPGQTLRLCTKGLPTMNARDTAF